MRTPRAAVSLFVFLTALVLTVPGARGPAHSGGGMADSRDRSTRERPEPVVQTGSWYSAACVIFSPDGRFVASGTAGEEVFLWDADSGHKLRVFRGPSGPVLGLDLNPDGSRLLCTSGFGPEDLVFRKPTFEPRERNHAKLWDTATGRVERRFEVKGQDLRGAAFGPGGKQILGFTDREALLWDIANPERAAARAPIPGGGRILAGAFRRRPRLLVRSAPGEVTLQEWDVQKNRFSVVVGPLKAGNLYGGAEAAPAPGPDPPRGNAPQAVPDRPMAALAADGRHVFTYSFRETPGQFFPDTLTTVVLWDAEGGKSRSFPLEKKNTIPGPFAVSPDGSQVLIGHVESLTLQADLKRGYGLTLWDRRSGKPLQTFRAPPLEGGFNAPTAASFSADGSRLVAGSADGLVRTYRIPSCQQLAVLGVLRPGVSALAFGRGGRQLFAGSIDGTVAEWDLPAGRPTRALGAAGGAAALKHTQRVLDMAVSPDGRWLATTAYDHQFLLWDVARGVAVKSQKARPPLFQGPFSIVTALAFGPDSRFLLTASIDERAKASLWRIPSLERVAILSGHKNDVAAVAISPDGRFALTGGGNPDRCLIVWDIADPKRPLRVAAGEHTAGVAAAAFHPSAPVIGTVSTDFHLSVWEGLKRLALKARVRLPIPPGLAWGSHLPTPRLAFQPFGKLLLTTSYDVATLWDVDSLLRGKPVAVHTLRGHTQLIAAAAFTPGGRSVVTGAPDGMIVWDTATGQQLCRLLNLPGQDWLVVNEGGPFDAGDLDDNPGLRWVFADKPFQALAPEIFTREYYEPRLLPRLLTGETFKKVKGLANLNRARPRVTITKVVQGTTPDVAHVTVEVSPVECQPGERAAHDLRLFRDGQLVAQWPEVNLEDRSEPDPDTPQGLAWWRKTTRIPPEGGDAPCRKTFSVRLPTRAGLARVEFSAYAFNCDRVRSAIARKPYVLPAGVKPRRARAYLVTMGLTDTESGSAWSLQFAGDDARRVRDALKGALQRAGEYDVVPILLATKPKEPELALMPKRLNLQAVLDLLAGRDAPPGWWEGLRERERRWLRSALRPATPDDLLLLAFSCHGITAPGGFFLVPFDIGLDAPDGVVTDSLLAHCLSGRQLAAWLRAVDAGPTALVIDACHSSAAVESGGFKPAPLGGRGLGQLAYDRRMSVLTASQTANSTYDIVGGLLSRALVEGLERPRALSGGPLTLSRLFAFAARRAPQLFRELRLGDDGTPVPRPSFFDFARGLPDPILRSLR